MTKKNTNQKWISTYVVLELKPIAGPARFVFAALAAVKNEIQKFDKKRRNSNGIKM